MSRDAYIRLGSRGTRHFGDPEHHSSIVFVDCPAEYELVGIRAAPWSIFRQAETMIVRADAPCASPSQDDRASASFRFTELAGQIEALRMNVRFGLLHQPVGQPAWIETSDGVRDIPDILTRARSVELEALLNWGDGVWLPTTYHYQLPSGEHAPGFVRVADAVQEPRDAEVLASWMHADLTDGAGFVTDTGTLASVVQALVAAQRSQGWRPGPTKVLDGYPATAFDVVQAVSHAGRDGGVLALLSVNSSGRVRDRLINALAQLPPAGARSLDILIDKSRIESAEADGGPSGAVRVRTWHPVPGERPLIAYGAESAERCDLCANQRTATIIPVSPRSFDGRLPSAIDRVTPLVSDAQSNRDLWEHCNGNADSGDLGGITFEGPPVDAMLPTRPRGLMAIVFDHGHLIAKEGYRHAAVSAFTRRLHDERRTPKPPDLLLVPEHENGYDGVQELLKAMADGPFGGTPDQIRTFPREGAWPKELQQAVRSAPEAIGVFCLGTVSGGVLQTALSAIQDARDPGGYELTAWVVHARPEERRAWQTLRNSYGGLLFTAWHTYLPDRSPFAEERDVLGTLSRSQLDDLSDNAKAFWDGRRELHQSRTSQDEGIFWGTVPSDRLTPNSIFGQDLLGPAVLTAVGSAMERARKERRSAAAPARRVFEMQAIVRSYYDPMILAAVLRWLQPHEAWWGWQLQDERVTIQQMLGRATGRHQAILVPELLLAAAQGKLSSAGARPVRAAAHALRAEEQLTDAQRGALDLGLALLGDPGTGDDAAARSGGARDRIRDAQTAEELLLEVPRLLRDLRQGRLGPELIAQLDDRINDLVVLW